MEIKQQDDILALIANHLAGLAGKAENEKLKDWIGMSVNNRQYFEQVRNIWDASDKKIDPQKIDTSEAFANVSERIRVGSGKVTFWDYWQKFAAVLILPLCIGFLSWIYLNSNINKSRSELVYNEVHSPFGTRSTFKLADSTIVWLNAGSTLKYPVKFNNEERKVFLNGEAYFEVESDASRPFIVKTSTLEVKATGTEFNVDEYNSETKARITLISGKVSVKENSDNSSQSISELKPGENFEYNKQTGDRYITRGEAYKYIAWKDGKLAFRNDPLSEVLDRIALIFNVDFEVHSDVFKDYSYRATFENESLEEILKLLKMSSPIDYIEVKREILPDGSFQKKKVIIFPAE